MRVVLDANVIIAAFAARGLCEAVLEFCLSGHEIILSDHLIGEIRKGLQSKIKLPSPTVNRIISFLSESSTILPPEPLPCNLCRDPNDVKVLGLSLAAQADYIITGYKDLLVLKKFKGIPILSPKSFSDTIHKK